MSAGRSPTGPQGILHSTVRGRTEPVRDGFIRPAVRRRDMSNVDEGVVMFNQQEKKLSQEEQDVVDENARKQAMRDLINSWQERLQLISLITTFFATTEAAMLVNARPATMDDLRNTILKVSNSGFLGALVLHVYASVLSFLGAFLLINHKVREAVREEMIIEGIPVTTSPLGKSVSNDVERNAKNDPSVAQASTNTDAQARTIKPTTTGLGQYKINLPSLVDPGLVFCADPHIEPVGPFASHASSNRVLSRIHSICVFLTATGFVLAIMGILSYAWAIQTREVGIFTSVCLGSALLALLTLVPRLSFFPRTPPFRFVDGRVQTKI